MWNLERSARVYMTIFIILAPGEFLFEWNRTDDGKHKSYDKYDVYIWWFLYIGTSRVTELSMSVWLYLIYMFIQLEFKIYQTLTFLSNLTSLSAMVS